MRNAAAEPWQRAFDSEAPWAHRQWTRVDPGAPEPLPLGTPDAEEGGQGAVPGPPAPWPLNATLAAWPRYCPGRDTSAGQLRRASARAASVRAHEATAAGLWGNRSALPWILAVDADSLPSVSADVARHAVAEAMSTAAAAHAATAVAAARTAWEAQTAAAAANASLPRPPPWPKAKATARLLARWDLGNVFLAVGAVSVAQRRAWERGGGRGGGGGSASPHPSCCSLSSVAGIVRQAGSAAASPAIARRPRWEGCSATARPTLHQHEPDV